LALRISNGDYVPVPIGADLIGVGLGPRSNQLLHGAFESGRTRSFEKVSEKGKRSFVHENPQLRNDCGWAQPWALAKIFYGKMENDETDNNPSNPKSEALDFDFASCPFFGVCDNRTNLRSPGDHP
jgi:hypothetical protein